MPSTVKSLFCCVLLVGLGADAVGAAEAPAKRATHKVTRQLLEVAIPLDGIFEAVQTREVAVSPRTWTKLTVRKAPRHGQRVKKGNRVLVLDTEGIDKAIADLEASQRAAKVSLRSAERELAAKEKALPLDLAAAERNAKAAAEDLARYRKTGRAGLQEDARVSLKNAKNYLEYQLEELRQLEKMYRADDLTEETEEIILKRQHDTVERARHSLKKSEAAAKLTLEVTVPRKDKAMEAAARRAALALEKARASLPLVLETERLQVAAQKRGVAEGDRKLQNLRRDRSRLTVEAPIDGVVYVGKCVDGKWGPASLAAARLEPGSTVQPGVVLFTVVAPRPLAIRVQLPEKNLHDVRPGVKGTAVAAGYPGLKLPVRVRSVLAVPVAPGLFDCRLAVEPSKRDRSVVAGMACKVRLVAVHKPRAIVVPAAGVFRGADGKPYALVVGKGGAPIRRAVSLGRSTAAGVEVTRGLREGEEILLENPAAETGS